MHLVRCRHELLRNQFASTVGKRLASERMVTVGKQNIMDHHRTTRWAENEYIAMLQLVQNNSSLIASAIDNFDAENPTVYFVDYVEMLTVNPQYQSAHRAAYDMYRTNV